MHGHRRIVAGGADPRPGECRGEGIGEVLGVHATAFARLQNSLNLPIAGFHRQGDMHFIDTGVHEKPVERVDLNQRNAAKHLGDSCIGHVTDRDQVVAHQRMLAHGGPHGLRSRTGSGNDNTSGCRSAALNTRCGTGTKSHHHGA